MKTAALVAFMVTALALPHSMVGGPAAVSTTSDVAFPASLADNQQAYLQDYRSWRDGEADLREGMRSRAVADARFTTGH